MLKNSIIVLSGQVQSWTHLTALCLTLVLFMTESRKNRPVPIATITKAHEDKDLSRVKPRWRRGMSKAMLNINPLQSVTSVLFQSDNLLLSSGSADGWVDSRKISSWKERAHGLIALNSKGCKGTAEKLLLSNCGYFQIWQSFHLSMVIFSNLCNSKM